jgi:hypothetical protein
MAKLQISSAPYVSGYDLLLPVVSIKLGITASVSNNITRTAVYALSMI